MTTILDPAASGVPHAHEATRPVATTYRRPPGLHTPRHLWVIWLVGCVGMGIDALLAASVVAEMFDLPDAGTYAIVFCVGLLAAVAATEAAISYNRQHGWAAAGLMALVFGVGASMAALRYVAGLGGSGAVDSSQFAGTPVASAHDGEWAAILLMLAMYCAAALGLFLAATKIFVAERGDLARHDSERRACTAQLAPLEAQYTAIHERVCYWKQHDERMKENLEHARAAADAREDSLKAYARDAIARAVGRPDATPLIRAPYVPDGDASATPDGPPPEPSA